MGAVAPELSDASEGAARRFQEPLAARIAHLARTGELPARRTRPVEFLGAIWPFLQRIG